MKKKEKLIIWPCVQLVLTILFAERPFQAPQSRGVEHRASSVAKKVFKSLKRNLDKNIDNEQLKKFVFINLFSGLGTSTIHSFASKQEKPH